MRKILFVLSDLIFPFCMYEVSPRQMSRRSKLETYFAIVEVIGNGFEKPTHIMYKANLSWSVMQRYIKNLELRGIVSCGQVEGKRGYHLTQKGFELLSKYLELKEDMSEEIRVPQSITIS